MFFNTSAFQSVPAPHPSMRTSRLSRRGFLSQLVFAQFPVVEDPGARALVCIFLRGGADTLNMIVPYGDGDYYRERPTLSIAAPGKRPNSAIRLDDFYGLHPKMAPMESIYKEGRFGIIQAVGSDNPTGSHFDAQDQIEHGESYGKDLGGGWLGRHLRSRSGDASGNPLSAIAIGSTLPESLRGAPSTAVLRSIDEMQLPQSSGDPRAVARALSKLYAAEVGVIGTRGRQTLDLLSRVEALHNKPYTPAAGAVYPNEPFGEGLREIARIIKADLGLEAACIDYGGWDTHYIQGGAGGMHASQVDTLSQGLAAFDADLKGYRDRVTTVVMTEFGRRLYENGSAGTDHGRGFVMMALGEQIHGGKIHGDWPGLKEEQFLPGPGGMEVKIDYRSVLCEILSHAVGHAKLDQVFPDFAPVRVGIAG